MEFYKNIDNYCIIFNNIEIRIKMNYPLVSVIIPCYNHQNYIEECLLSVLNQSYKNIQLIVIDDGSKDNSVSIIEKIREEYTFIFEKQNNIGLSKTINKVLKKYVTGEFVCTLASDDFWDKNKVKIQVDYLNANKQYDFVFSNAYIINHQSQITGSFDEARLKHNCSLEDLMLDKYGIPALTVMLRKSVFDGVGLFDENLAIEDWDMWMRIAETRQLACIYDKLAYYRMHDSNTTLQIELMMDGRLQIIEKWKTIYPEVYIKALKYWRTQALIQFAKTNKKAAAKYLKFNWNYLTDMKYRKYVFKYLFSKRF